MKFIYEKNRIYLNDENNEVIAEILFPLVSENTVDINRTYVSEVLRGQGVAGKLMEAALKTIEENGWNAKTSCSYAEKRSEKHPEKADLFV